MNLRVSYDHPDSVSNMIRWLVDADPIELRDLAENLLADVETLKAELAAAEERGYRRAIDQLRQLATTSGPLFTPKQMADYLEASTDER